MKRIILFVMAVVLVLSAVSCSGNDNENDTGSITSDIPEASDGTTEGDQPTVEITPPEYKNIQLIFDDTKVCVSKNHANEEAGTLVTYYGWSSTDHMDVSGWYGFEYELSSHWKFDSVSFYDADKQYISGIGTNNMMISSTGSLMGFTKVPESAKYARFIKYDGILNYDMPEYTDGFVHVYETEEDYETAYGMSKYRELVIACLGDSLTEGDYGTTENKTNRHYKNYPYYLSKALGCTTLNYGKCGANSQSYYSECYVSGNADISEADVILVMLGTNRGLDGDYKFYYTKLLDKIAEDKKEGAIVIMVAPPSATNDPNKAHYGWRPNVMSAVSTVKELMSKRGLPIINSYRHSPIQPSKEDIYQPVDGLHLSEEGYRVFAEFMADEIVKILEKE